MDINRQESSLKFRRKHIGLSYHYACTLFLDCVRLGRQNTTRVYVLPLADDLHMIVDTVHDRVQLCFSRTMDGRTVIS